MSTAIHYIENHNGKLRITVEDPTRSITKTPGSVRISDVSFSGLMLKPTKDAILAAVDRPMPIKGYGSTGGLQRITVESPLTEAEINVLAANFNGGNLSRVGGSAGSTPPEDTFSPPLEKTEESSNSTTILVVAVVLAALTFLYIKFR